MKMNQSKSFVIPNGATLQARRGISRSSSLARKPNLTP
jgi:hypothetical protein